jgi:hypothetical protein
MPTDRDQGKRPATESTLEEEMAHWHIEEAAWKVTQILRMLARHHLDPRTICEVGSGSGDMLAQLQPKLEAGCTFQGYELSSHAINYSQKKENERLHFKLMDIREETAAAFDLMLVMDVLEHIENCRGFLREIKPRAEYKIFQVALNISAQTVLRRQGLPDIRLIYGMRNTFTRDLLLQTFQQAGYELIDFFYTSPSIDLPTHVFKKRLMKIPRRVLFGLNQDLAARLLGGYRLLVLAR